MPVLGFLEVLDGLWEYLRGAEQYSSHMVLAWARTDKELFSTSQHFCRPKLQKCFRRSDLLYRIDNHCARPHRFANDNMA